jgi:hypothetical protein
MSRPTSGSSSVSSSPILWPGFSGGYQGIFPAVADIDSIIHYHRAEVIGDPRSTWAVLDGNPTQEQIRRYGSLLPVDFCINVTLNRKREITGLLLRRGDRGARAGLRLLEDDGDGSVRRAVSDHRHDQQRLSARSEPLPGGKGNVGGGAGYRTQDGLILAGVTLQRRLSGSRKLQEAAL